MSTQYTDVGQCVEISSQSIWASPGAWRFRIGEVDVSYIPLFLIRIAVWVILDVHVEYMPAREEFFLSS